jgi:hypothetical protein
MKISKYDFRAIWTRKPSAPLSVSKPTATGVLGEPIADRTVNPGLNALATNLSQILLGRGTKTRCGGQGIFGGD